MLRSKSLAISVQLTMPATISLERYTLNRQYKAAVSAGDIAAFHDAMTKLYAYQKTTNNYQNLQPQHLSVGRAIL